MANSRGMIRPGAVSFHLKLKHKKLRSYLPWSKWSLIQKLGGANLNIDRNPSFPHQRKHHG